MNQHRDLDLAEQDLLSCSGGGDCTGGQIVTTLEFVASNGVVSEDCFPYQEFPVQCGSRCADIGVTLFLEGIIDVPLQLGIAEIKRALVFYGPLTFGIRSWWHLMILVGYDRDPVDGRTIWIVKNSWGPDWGEDGYARLKIGLSDIYSVYAVESVRLIENGRVVGNLCRDADADGYAAWGLNSARPAGCATIDDLQDCNDADPGKGERLDTGACALIDFAPEPPPVPDPDPPSSVSGGGGATGLTPLLLAALVITARVRSLKSD